MLVERLYEVVAELEAEYPGGHFTPDGHLVGSLGEALAKDAFGLTLATASNKGYDATISGRKVEVKTTQRRAIALSADVGEELLDGGKLHLIGVQIHPKQVGAEGWVTVAYNGPARPVWDQAGRAQKNGQRTISIKRLLELDASVRNEDRLGQVADLPGAQTATQS